MERRLLQEGVRSSPCRRPRAAASIHASCQNSTMQWSLPQALWWDM